MKNLKIVISSAIVIIAVIAAIIIGLSPSVRSPACDQQGAVDVSHSGNVDIGGTSVKSNNGVRPALNIEF